MLLVINTIFPVSSVGLPGSLLFYHWVYDSSLYSEKPSELGKSRLLEGMVLPCYIVRGLLTIIENVVYVNDMYIFNTWCRFLLTNVDYMVRVLGFTAIFSITSGLHCITDTLKAT